MSSAPANPQPSLLAAIRDVVDFAPSGDAIDNLTLGRGSVAGTAVHVALIESRIASGSLGMKECARLAQLFRVVAVERIPLLLYLDCAGARVSEGLPALGAFRAMFSAALYAALSGAPIVTLLGNKCFGGASMLAHLGRVRIFSPATQLAMSGPSILALAAGTSALDEIFRAMAQATISAEARSKASGENLLFEDQAGLSATVTKVIEAAASEPAYYVARHHRLGERLGKLNDGSWDRLQRRDLERLFPQGYNVLERDGVVAGEATHEGTSISILGIVGGKPLGVARAWTLADRAWGLAESEIRPTMLLLDCDSHSAKLDDEKLVLSEYLCDLSFAFASLKNRGLTTSILGKAGGGVYVAFAAPAQRVALVHGAHIQVLPGSVIASILGENIDSRSEFDDYRNAGVADEALRIGLVPE
jgi:hypothetical protein